MTVFGAHTIRGRKTIEDGLARVHELFPILQERSGQVVGTLSGGEQQMCAIGRALVSMPKPLLIDELSLGLAPWWIDWSTSWQTSAAQAGRWSSSNRMPNWL
jgi:branched-chain amino acid transport system ATP-binding protein